MAVVFLAGNFNVRLKTQTSGSQCSAPCQFQEQKELEVECFSKSKQQGNVRLKMDEFAYHKIPVLKLNDQRSYTL